MKPRGWILFVTLAISGTTHAWLLWNARSPAPVLSGEVAAPPMEVSLIVDVPLTPDPMPLPPPPEPLPEQTPESTPEPIVKEKILVSENAIIKDAAPTPRPKMVPAVTPKPQLAKPMTPAAPPIATKAKVPAVIEAAPDYARNPPPRYPETARRNGWVGTVLVRAVVGSNGRASSVSLQRSSGYGILDQAALSAVRGWKFIPRRTNGEATGSTVEVPVNFSLNR